MTAGFQAFTDSGLVQIDGTSQNWVLRQTINIVTAGGIIPVFKSNAGVQYTLTANVANLSISAVCPLIVLYCPGAYATVLKCAQIDANNWSVLIWSNTAAAVTVYVFDQAASAAPSGPGYGLQVFDESGTLVFDARQRAARVIDTQTGNIMNTGAAWGQWGLVTNRSYSFSYPTVSKIGVGALGTAFLGAAGGSNVGWYCVSGAQTSGNSLNLVYQYYSVGGASQPQNVLCFGSQFDWRFMAIDLSNI